MSIARSSAALVEALDASVLEMERLVRTCERSKQREQDKVGRSPGVLYFYPSLWNSLTSRLFHDDGGFDLPNQPTSFGRERGR